MRGVISRPGGCERPPRCVDLTCGGLGPLTYVPERCWLGWVSVHDAALVSMKNPKDTQHEIRVTDYYGSIRERSSGVRGRCHWEMVHGVYRRGADAWLIAAGCDLLAWSTRAGHLCCLVCWCILIGGYYGAITDATSLILFTSRHKIVQRMRLE